MSAFDYDGLKRLAKELGKPVTALLALARQNDPFFAGLPFRRESAEWFADVWRRFGFQRGIHLRGIHYTLVSQRDPVRLWDGTSYENTLECWKKLGRASRDARHLGLVPADSWSDKKNSAFEYLVDSQSAAVQVLVAVEPAFGMPGPPELGLVRPTALQPYHVELWTEKSGISDLLRSLADQYKLNVVVGEGEISVTQCDNLIDRALKSRRPVRILYISDFDPAGQSMPLACARKIEHALYRRKIDRLDIQVRPVALTKEQVIEFDIPSIPIKESERRAADFQAQHGGLAAELDALEVLRPGELRRILVEEIERYFDTELESAIEATADEYEQELSDITEEVHEQHRADLDELEEAWGEVEAEFRDWQRRAELVWQAIRLDLRDQMPDQPDWPEADGGDDDPDALFDSKRNYLEQMSRYKRYQNRPCAWGDDPDEDEGDED